LIITEMDMKYIIVHTDDYIDYVDKMWCFV